MNPIILDLKFFQIRWYSLFILIAFSVGYVIVKKKISTKAILKTNIVDLFFYMVIVCLIGARLYYCIFNFEYYSKNIIDVFKVWEGGLAIHGGMIAGILYLFYYCNKKKTPFFELSDTLVIALAIGQSIGRWGNFFNSEAYGPITTLNNLEKLHIPNFIIKGMFINGEYRIPTFLYESIGCFLIFIIILLIGKKRIGQKTAIYFILYGILRFYIESLRQDSLMLFEFKMAQIVSLFMIFIGMILFIISYKQKKI